MEVEQNHRFSSDAVSVDHEGPGRGADTIGIKGFKGTRYWFGRRGRRDGYKRSDRPAQTPNLFLFAVL